MFSYCVPSYNSLPYLKILYASLKKNAKIPYEFIVHNNGSTDDTQNWLSQNKIKYTKSQTNLGFTGVNAAIKQAKYPYVMILNSDMYVIPGFDFAILNQITQFKKNKVDKFSISCTLIENTR